MSPFDSFPIYRRWHIGPISVWTMRPIRLFRLRSNDSGFEPLPAHGPNGPSASLPRDPISGGTCGMRLEPISVFEPAMEYTTFGWSRAIAIEKFDIGLLGLCGPSDISAVAYWSDIGLAHGPMVHMGHLTLPEPISKVACMVDIEQVPV